MIQEPSLRTRHIIQGQHFISESPQEVLSTLLGSCVAACFHDPVLKIGGMNHFLLPGSDPRSNSCVRYGAHSMEELVNGLLRRGSRRERLQVWIFGGANVLDGLTKIGDSNAEFARTFVRTEGYRLMGEETGGRQGRKLRFHAATGRSQVERLARSIPEVAPRASAQAKPVGDVELF